MSKIPADRYRVEGSFAQAPLSTQKRDWSRKAFGMQNLFGPHRNVRKTKEDKKVSWREFRRNGFTITSWLTPSGLVASVGCRGKTVLGYAETFALLCTLCLGLSPGLRLFSSWSNKKVILPASVGPASLSAPGPDGGWRAPSLQLFWSPFYF